MTKKKQRKENTEYATVKRKKKNGLGFFGWTEGKNS
jgi:hypothetical protein